MPHGTRAFFYPYSLETYSLGTDLNEHPNWVSINERVVLYKLFVCAFMRVRLRLITHLCVYMHRLRGNNDRLAVRYAKMRTDARVCANIELSEMQDVL